MLREKFIAWLLLCALALPRAFAGDSVASATATGAAGIGAPEIDAAFHLLYELKFAEARARLGEWERAHPGDPLGPAAEAASDLFEEFYAQGVLTSGFFLNDRLFLNGIKGKPDAARGAAFAAANRRAQDLATARLKTNPQDANALFAMTITDGMQAEYTSIIEKHQLDGLHFVRAAEEDARRLLAVAPDAADAYLGLGAANYIIGSLPVHKRFFLWLGGIHRDKIGGMKQLGETASHGHFLRPFAKLFLALAELREKQIQPAREEFRQLAAEFPQNPLFQKELAKIDSGPAQTGSAR
jgi:hypothetical protein